MIVLSSQIIEINPYLNHTAVLFYVQDIPASENTDFYMFKNLLPNRNYTVSVSMRNGVGEGPPATTMVSTPPEPTGNQ